MTPWWQVTRMDEFQIQHSTRIPPILSCISDHYPDMFSYTYLHMYFFSVATVSAAALSVFSPGPRAQGLLPKLHCCCLLPTLQKNQPISMIHADLTNQFVRSAWILPTTNLDSNTQLNPCQHALHANIQHSTLFQQFVALDCCEALNHQITGSNKQ